MNAIGLSERATQNRIIAAILSGMDDEIAALEVKLAKARSLKQDMMQGLLTGKIRLGSRASDRHKCGQDGLIPPRLK